MRPVSLACATSTRSTPFSRRAIWKIVSSGKPTRRVAKDRMLLVRELLQVVLEDLPTTGGLVT